MLTTCLNLLVDIKENLSSRFNIEREQSLLWVPVVFACGIAFYFVLGQEPVREIAILCLVASLTLIVILRRSRVWRILLTGIAIALFGFCAAQWRTGQVSAPQIDKKIWGKEVEGNIISLSRHAKGQYKVIVGSVAVAGLPLAKTPDRVSISVRTKGAAVRPGDRIQVKAVLMPLPTPALPGGFDYARKAFFERLGAVGFAIGPVSKILDSHPGNEPFFNGLRVYIEKLRDTLAQRLKKHIPGQDGAVAAALTTGLKGAIPDQVHVAMQNSGLAHLLAISGLHLGLVTGLVFVMVRAGLSLVPSIALKYPIKKWAAVIAAIAATGYLVISGGSLPTQRAYLMGCLMLVAIIFDRDPLSLRLVAFAAMFILLITPESLLSVSFQMSFAAVVGLITVYDLIKAPVARWRQTHPGLVSRSFLYLFLVCITTIVAEIAIAPVAIFHFNRIAMYGLLANLLAVPLMGFWIMPWAVIAFILMPLHLDFLACAPLGWGIHAMLFIAEKVSALSGAVTIIPGFSAFALGLIVLGVLWLCLWRNRTAGFAGVLPVIIGIVMAAHYRMPDILIGRDGKIIAVKGGEGNYLVSSLRGGRYARNVWLRQNGQKTAQKWPFNMPDTDNNSVLACENDDECVYSPPLTSSKSIEMGQASGKISRKTPMIVLRSGEDDPTKICQRANVLISAKAIRQKCRGPFLMIDWFDLYYQGAHAIWIDYNGNGKWRFTVKTAESERGHRPWTSPPKPPDWRHERYETKTYFWPVM